jgi:hypothetical protein
MQEPSNSLEQKVEEVIKLAQYIQGRGQYVISDYEALSLAATIYQTEALQMELNTITERLQEIDSSVASISENTNSSNGENM